MMAFLTVLGLTWLAIAAILLTISMWFPFGPAAERPRITTGLVLYLAFWPITFAYGLVKIWRMNRD